VQVDHVTLGDGGGSPGDIALDTTVTPGWHTATLYAMPAVGPMDWAHPVATVRFQVP
jgi:hypothetical protein